MREKRQLDRIFMLIDEFKGEIPLQHFLRNYFRRHHEMGANDRRLTSQFIYGWFRLGKALTGLQKEERLAIASFLAFDSKSALHNFLFSDMRLSNYDDASDSLEARINFIRNEYPQFKPEEILSFSNLTSKQLDYYAFSKSILQQPYLWLRSKSGCLEIIKDTLIKNSIPFEVVDHSIGIIKTVELSKVPGLKQVWFEIQDLSSQLTGNYFYPQAGDHWYDCCAASGGKSLLLHSINPDVSLTVSDNREKILNNLELRFKKNGISDYTVEMADLEKNVPAAISSLHFDGIIADVPCTGSGTWSRSPEQISFFNAESVQLFALRQRKIIGHIAPLLSKGKPLIYITCSVFKAENEDNIDWIIENCHFSMEKSALIQGAERHADTMFVARLIKD